MILDLDLYRKDIVVSATPHVRLSVVDTAPERPDQTLVLIAGFGGSVQWWRNQIDVFSRRHRVIAIDMRGHGRSSRPVSGYTVAQMALDVAAALDELQIGQPVVLLGHSFGGAIAVEFARTFPQRTARLVLIATPGEFQARYVAPIARFLFHRSDLVVRIVQRLYRRMPRQIVDADALALKRLYHNGLTAWRGWDVFPQVQTPTLVILGHADTAFPEADFARVAELLPNVEVVNVGVSRHQVIRERPDAVNRAIRRFIEPEGAAPGALYGADAEAIEAERPWLAAYEVDVPETVDIPQAPLTRIFDRAVERFPRRPAIRYLGHNITYRDLDAEIDRCANALQALGVAAGERVLLLLPNVPHFVIAYYAALRLGAIVALCNPLAPSDEIVEQAQSAGALVLIALARHAATAAQVRERSSVRHVIYADARDYAPRLALSEVRRRADERPADDPLDVPLRPGDHLWRPLLRRQPARRIAISINPTATAVIVFTGGATGAPKGVMLSHRNLVANVVQIRAWAPAAVDGREAFLCVVPFSHVYGMTASMNLAIKLGATIILLTSFDPAEALEQIKRNRPSFFPGVPTMYVAINVFPNVRQFKLRSVRFCISGAAPLPVEVKEAFERLTKGRLVEGYGLSEASPVTHINPINGRHKAGSIGIPLPNTEARIVDLRSGKTLPPGQIGELVVRGPQVMQGYWRDPEASAAALTPDGWLATGDIAVMDAQGYFQIISRRQDMWHADDATPVFPRAVEEVIYELPEVREAAVIAIANQPIAFVSLKNSERLPAQTIIAFCQRRLPPSHVPRLVFFVKDLPHSFIGKILRRELVSQYERAVMAEAGSVGDHLAGLEDG